MRHIDRTFLWLNTVMVLTLFLLSIFPVFHFLDKPKAIAAIFTASGISITGLLYYMTYLWRQIVGINMGIAMADHLSSKDLAAIINSLLATIKTPKSGK